MKYWNICKTVNLKSSHWHYHKFRLLFLHISWAYPGDTRGWVPFWKCKNHFYHLFCMQASICIARPPFPKSDVAFLKSRSRAICIYNSKHYSLLMSKFNRRNSNELNIMSNIERHNNELNKIINHIYYDTCTII